MSQMTNVQVVDPITTTVARGYTNAEYVGSSLFPIVTVGLRGGKIIEFNRDSFRLYETARAPGSKVAVAQFGYSGKSYALVDHALNGLVPVEHLEDAKESPGIDLASGAVRFVRDIILKRLEIEQATLARTASLYASSNKITLSGTSQWSDYSGTSDPSKDMAAWKDAVRSKIGRNPNTALLSASAMKAASTHPKILDRIKYTSRDSATAAMLSALWEINVKVGNAVYLDAASNMQDVWGKDIVLGYTETSPLANMGAPSYGYTYRLANYPIVEQAMYDKDYRSWVYPVSDCLSAVMPGADAGFLVINAVA